MILLNLFYRYVFSCLYNQFCMLRKSMLFHQKINVPKLFIAVLITRFPDEILCSVMKCFGTDLVLFASIYTAYISA